MCSLVPACTVKILLYTSQTNNTASILDLSYDNLSSCCLKFFRFFMHVVFFMHVTLVFLSKELFAYGLSNSVSAFFSCFPSAASLSRSLIQESLGSTQVFAKKI